MSYRKQRSSFAARAAAPFMAVVVAVGMNPTAMASEAASRASEASIQSLSVLPAASIELLMAGGRFTVVALRPVGHAIEAVLHSAATGSEIAVRVSVATAQAAAIVVGSAIEVSAVAGGHILRAGSEAIAFVPDAEVAAMVYRMEIRR